MDGQKGAGAGRHAEGAPGVLMGGERHTVATHRHDSPDLKGTVDVCQPTLILSTVPHYIAVNLHAKYSICLLKKKDFAYLDNSEI